MIVLGQIIFPIAMMCVYYLSGYYNEVFTKSRLQEVLTTILTSGINSLLIFFTALINDMFLPRSANYELLLTLWALLFAAVYFSRFIITNNASHRIKTGQWSFNTLVIGRGSAATAFVHRLENMPEKTGFNVVGFVSLPGENDVKAIDRDAYELSELDTVCMQNNIKRLIVVPTKYDSPLLGETLNKLFPLNLPILFAPDKNNILLSRVKLNNVYGDPLVNISTSSMTESSKNIKRVFDILISLIVLIVLSPILLFIAIAIKIDSKGDIIYKQERVGYHNKPFNIYKFRSMIQDAEKDNEPMLSSENDDRITKIGRFMRKYRIDELPQFWNVLKGDMAIVGPRPERRYYVDLITERVPAYVLVHQVRPGITSLAMVKFGYASTIDEMVERLNFDLIYLENMSLVNDLKIMIYTIKTILTGRGI